jgi:hypothetical protein
MRSQARAFMSRRKEKTLEKFARFGLICKGIVYVLIGILAIMAAMGLSNKKADRNEALGFIYEQPFGQLLLVTIGIGLAGYVTWRFFQTFRDTENAGSDSSGLLKRAGYAFSGVVYAGIGYLVIRTALNGPSSDNGSSREFLISKALQHDAGVWLIGIAALFIAGRGIRQIYMAVSGKVKLINSEYHDTFKNTGLIGFIARGIVLCIIGYFLFQAALNANPSEAQGTSGAFDFLQNNFGSLMMALVSIGLMAYGVFMFVKAKYEKINIR